MSEFEAERQQLIEQRDELLAALKALTQDSRFNLVIGGNPNAVDALVKQVDLAVAKAEGQGNNLQAICMFCDGTGWCEGSPAFTCPRCKGSGTAEEPQAVDAVDPHAPHTTG